MNPLATYGWTPALAAVWREQSAPDLIPARVVADFGTSLKIATPELLTAELSGKLAHYTDRDAVPKVGDWVGARISKENHAVIELLIPRYSEIARKAAGNQTVKQILAANVDLAFIVLAVGNDFSVERLRRFLYQLSISTIKPIIILNKADMTNDIEPYMEQLKPFGLPIIKTIASQGDGVNEVLATIEPGSTAVLMGSSGVGKSTLINQLLGNNVQAVKEVRESDETGQHTTVHRELFMLPSGGLLVDMPGIRELQLWGEEEELADTFEDVEILAHQCKFSNCRHGSEAGCAVQKALETGLLNESRYAAYVRMKSELHLLKARREANNKRRSAERHQVAKHKKAEQSRFDRSTDL